jgi:MoaA/NifB/PqqE/SkfB family radical SAM enzyme
MERLIPLAARPLPGDVDLSKVEIHATDLCNNRCGFCTTGWLNDEKSEQLVHPPRELIRHQLEDAYQRGARRVLFQGGEPTIRRDLGDLLADAHEIGYQVTTIFTNARMAASRAGAAWMAAMRVTWFQVSIQGGTAAAHDASVGAKGAFEQTVSGARRLLALGQRVKVNGVLTRHLLETLPEFADLMVSLRPEEVGLDTIKDTGAFGPGLASYAELCPPYSRFSSQLRDAVLKINRAGVIARLTAFPPCLVPGAEEFVSEEKQDTLSGDFKGQLFDKQSYKRKMMVKVDGCAACAYDDSCGGVYRPYADANGLDELAPIARRKERVPEVLVAAEEVPLTRALRALFVREGAGHTLGVREVARLADGSHELRCATAAGEFTVRVEPRGDGPAYATTERFAITYRSEAGQAPPDRRVLDAVVRTLRRAEAYLGAAARAAASATRPAEPTAR